MAITVNSPYSGHPVEVRDQDVGRVVRDDDGRIFYVIRKRDGHYYGSKTRAGGSNEEYHAHEIEQELNTAEPAVMGGRDATDKQRRGLRGVLVVILLAAIVTVLCYLFSPYGPFNWSKVERGETPKPNPIPVG